MTAPSIYSAFYLFVPGFDGLRVPARFAMIVALGLAVLAGYGIVMLRHARFSGAVVAVSALLIMAESFAAPLPMNQNDVNYRQHDLAPLPAVLAIGTAAPRVYLVPSGRSSLRPCSWSSRSGSRRSTCGTCFMKSDTGARW